MPKLIRRLAAPLTVTQTFELDDGDSVTITAQQAKSRMNLRRTNELRSRVMPGERDDLMSWEIIPPLIRQMVDAFCASVETDLIDEDGNPIFSGDLTLIEYQDIWGLQDLDMPVMAWRPPESATEIRTYTIREMIMEVVYRANPLWDPFRDDETGESTRPLQGYGS